MFCVSPHPSMGPWVASASWLSPLMLPRTRVDRRLCQSLLAGLVTLSLDMGLPDPFSTGFFLMVCFFGLSTFSGLVIAELARGPLSSWSRV